MTTKYNLPLCKFNINLMKTLSSNQIGNDNNFVKNDPVYKKIHSFSEALNDFYGNNLANYVFLPDESDNTRWIYNDKNTPSLTIERNIHWQQMRNEYSVVERNTTSSIKFYYHFDPNHQNVKLQRNGIWCKINLIFLYIPIGITESYRLKCFSRFLNYRDSDIRECYSLPVWSEINLPTFPEPQRLYKKELGVFNNEESLLKAAFHQSVYLFTR